MTSPTRIAMLEAILRRQEIYILLVHEVTYHVLDDLQGYTTQYNIGANTRVTAIVARDGINLENIMSRSGGAIAAKVREVWIINVYAQTGTAMKQEGERFLNSELPYLVTDETGHILLGGDFNCILEGFGHYRRLHLKTSISGIGAWPNINRHLAGQPLTQSLHPQFRVRGNQD